MDGNTIEKSNTDWIKQPLLVEQIFELSPDCMLILSMPDKTFLQVNQHTCDLFGYSKEEFMNIQLEQLFNSKSGLEEVQTINANSAVGETTEIEVMGKRANDSIIFLRLRYSKIDDQQALLVIRDISEQQQITLLNRELSEIVDLQEQYNHKIQVGRQVLKMVAKQQSLNDILEVLCKGIERLLTNIKVSIFVSRDEHLYFAAAPNLPQGFIDKINGTPIEADALPCGVAVYNREEVLIEDLKNNKEFNQCKAIAEEYNICSCWSIPIFSSSGNDVLGSFAFYSEYIIKPDFSIDDLIAMATDLAAVAIEQANSRETLTSINEQYVNQNRELQATKRQLEADKSILLDREEKLKEAQRLSKVGSWELDLITNNLTWSTQQYITYGLEGIKEEELFMAYQACIHPDDIDNLTNAITDINYPNTTFNYEHRLTGRGAIHYIMGTGRVVYNEKKEVIFIKGTEQDVTTLKLAEQRALENELQFNELMANINEIIFAVHIKNATTYDNPIIYINGDTNNIFGYSHQELMDNPTLWPNSIHPEDKEHVIVKGKELHETEQKVTREYRFKHKKGHYVWIEDNISVGNSEGDGQRRVYGSARDISQRKASETASLEIKERLELAKEAADLGNYDWKVEENDLHWDDRMHEIFGLDRNDTTVTNKNAYIESILHPDDKRRVVDDYLKNLEQDKETFNFKNNYRIILEGKIKYIESYVIFIRNEHGKIRRVIGACLDVTERKEAEDLLISNEEKAVLLKEIHHRVKNNLQVITSLLSLQSNFLEDDKQRKIFADSQYRINSMAIVHELLYQSDNLSKLDYQDYLEQLSQYLISSIKGEDNKIQLQLDVANIKLSIDTAIPLGLLINEVLTNSLKYGIKGDQAGCISIRIFKEVTEEEARPSFILEIGDDGIGYPDTVNYRNSNSLGLKLIHNLTRQLEGTVTKDLEKKGTNYIIAFKEI